MVRLRDLWETLNREAYNMDTGERIDYAVVEREGERYITDIDVDVDVKTMHQYIKLRFLEEENEND